MPRHAMLTPAAISANNRGAASPRPGGASTGMPGSVVRTVPPSAGAGSDPPAYSASIKATISLAEFVRMK